LHESPGRAAYAISHPRIGETARVVIRPTASPTRTRHDL